MSMLTVTVSLTFIVCCGICQLYRKRSSVPPLPSPPGDPILGHLRYMPDIDQSDTVYLEWGRKYGDVFMLNILGKPIVIVNSEKAAMELLEKRSSIYSDRPPMPILERCGWKDAVIIAEYGQEWTNQRRLIQRTLAKATIPEYSAIQEEEADLLLQGLLERPQDYLRTIRRFTAGILMTVVHGHRIRSWDDEYFKLAADIDLLRHTVNPSLLDISSYFDYVPSWFPGAWHVKYIKEARPILQNIILLPVRRVWEDLLAGKVLEPSFTANYLKTLSAEGKIGVHDYWSIEMASSMILAGGIDTSLQTLQWFIACMVLHPDAQAKAQREIDEVVGRDRLPSFADKDNLPYVQCIMHEVMRHSLIVPLGIPHKSRSEDVYRGMRVPKGATIIVNSRGINWDETSFHEPHLFKPERFLPKPAGAGETFSEGGVFGWGRRMCPGRHLADANIWLAIARILAVITITKTRDSEGNVITPKIESYTGLVRCPKPFAFDMRPRDSKASTLVQGLRS